MAGAGSKPAGEDSNTAMMWLQIAVAVLVILLAVSVWHAYSKNSEVELLKTKNEKLIETKGRCEAREMFISEKEEAVKQSSETHVANTDRLMDMLKDVQDSLVISRGDSVKREEECSKQFSALRDNLTELVKKKERLTMQVSLFSEKLQACKTSVQDGEAKLAECKRQYNRCWWC